MKKKKVNILSGKLTHVHSFVGKSVSKIPDRADRVIAKRSCMITTRACLRRSGAASLLGVYETSAIMHIATVTTTTTTTQTNYPCFTFLPCAVVCLFYFETSFVVLCSGIELD